MVEIKIDFLPPSVNSYWKNTGNRIYLSREARDYKFNLFYFLKISKIKTRIMKGDLKVELILNFKDKRKRDIDNYNKGIFDGFNGLLWDDDSQIKMLEITKNIGTGKDSFIIKVKEL
ncbi:MAG: RusA family crossover junction endodeoxyribonuclease [Cetobacterium sp.]